MTKKSKNIYVLENTLAHTDFTNLDVIWIKYEIIPIYLKDKIMKNFPQSTFGYHG